MDTTAQPASRFDIPESPFEQPSEQYLLLSNHAGQCSLWPARIPVPHGWTVAFGPATRQHCLQAAR